MIKVWSTFGIEAEWELGILNVARATKAVKEFYGEYRFSPDFREAWMEINGKRVDKKSLEGLTFIKIRELIKQYT